VSRSGPRRTSPAPEELLDELVTVRDLAAGGRGVARLADGRAVFVPRAFPGDVVRLESGRARGSFVEAERWVRVAAGPHDVAPVCADYGRCGGCDWMALSLEAQRRHKADIVRQSLLRVGRVPAERLGESVPIRAGQGLGYRQRIRLQLEGRRLGYFAEGSRTLVEPQYCHVCSPELWDAVCAVRTLLADEQAVPAAWLEDVGHIEIRMLAESVRPALAVGCRDGAPAPRLLLRRLAEIGFTEADAGEPERQRLTDEVYALLPPGGFVQVNAEMNAHLISEVLGIASGLQARTALDVFCGVGNFALPLASQGIETLGLERSAESVRHAARAAREQGLRATFRAGPADRLVSRLADEGARFDLVIVDPPRAGAKGLAPLLARLARCALVMISCDPVTLARDVAALEGAGWQLTRILAVDMFPETHHVESLAEFRPASSPHSP